MPGTTKKTEDRGKRIARRASTLYARGETLPAARRKIAKELGETADGTSLLGTVDPIYYRLAGLAVPLAGIDSDSTERKLASAIRRRRDGRDGAKPAEGTPKGLGLVRWETVAGSASVAYGAPVSVREAKRLYAKGGGDLDASYAGRGTRKAAPASLAPDAREARVVRA